MELAVDLEDDLFFADISKQISLLIMDEDSDVPLAVCSSVSFQQLKRDVYRGGNYQTTAAGGGAALSPYMNEVERWGRRESKGTGVFIPRSSQPRRRHHHAHKQGRFCSVNSKSQSRHNPNHHQQPQQGNNISSSNGNASNTRRV